MNILLSLDLSTTSTGFAKFNIDTGELLEYGVVKPKGVGKHPYPKLQVYKIRNLREQILELVTSEVTKIIIEEINKGKNRIGQKTLDGAHYMILDKLEESDLDKVAYFDSDGNKGWRSKAGLALELSDTEKSINKERKKLNKKLARKDQFPLITKKTLACNFVNKRYNLELDVDLKSSDADIADAIGLGTFYLEKIHDR